jgi:indolepyruvate ferredoxin oxidoreductase, beta subunit
MKKTINFMLAGVGGQGTILASDVLANVGLAAGYQAKQAEVHGMSQRGGSVTSYVRWGETVYSPIVGAGEVDVFLTFEKVEALRNLDQLRPGALTVVSLEAIKPVTVTSGGQPYPDDAHIRACLAQVTPKAFYVDVQAIAAGLGNPKVSNVALMGALSGLMESQGISEPELTAETWLAEISARVPKKTIELNKKAFMAGREAVRL